MVSSAGDPVWRSDLPASQVAIITALELEAHTVRKALSPGGPSIHVSGPGPDHAAASARYAISSGARALVSIGLAGGLSSVAQTGTVCLPLILISATGRWPVDAGWHERLKSAIASLYPVIDQPLFSARHVVTTPSEKNALAEKFEAALVDMESAAIAEVAEDAELPFIALRVIADGPFDSLPSDVDSLVRPDGKTRYASLIPYLWSWRKARLLARLARKSGAARRQLAVVLASLSGTAG